MLISDSSERLAGLRILLGKGVIEIASTPALEELPRELNGLAAGECDLVVVDVAPSRLAEVLKKLRTNSQTGEVPLLVEASGLSTAAYLWGVLPAYRAMPCSMSELRRLICQRILCQQNGGKTEML